MTSIKQVRDARSGKRVLIVEVNDLLSIEPGQCLELKLESGEWFTIMHSDDANHVMSLCGLTTKKLDEFQRPG